MEDCLAVFAPKEIQGREIAKFSGYYKRRKSNDRSQKLEKGPEIWSATRIAEEELNIKYKKKDRGGYIHQLSKSDQFVFSTKAEATDRIGQKLISQMILGKQYRDNPQLLSLNYSVQDGFLGLYRINGFNHLKQDSRDVRIKFSGPLEFLNGLYIALSPENCGQYRSRQNPQYLMKDENKIQQFKLRIDSEKWICLAHSKVKCERVDFLTFSKEQWDGAIFVEVFLWPRLTNRYTVKSKKIKEHPKGSVVVSVNTKHKIAGIKPGDMIVDKPTGIGIVTLQTTSPVIYEVTEDFSKKRLSPSSDQQIRGCHEEDIRVKKTHFYRVEAYEEAEFGKKYTIDEFKRDIMNAFYLAVQYIQSNKDSQLWDAQEIIHNVLPYFYLLEESDLLIGFWKVFQIHIKKPLSELVDEALFVKYLQLILDYLMLLIEQELRRTKTTLEHETIKFDFKNDFMFIIQLITSPHVSIYKGMLLLFLNILNVVYNNPNLCTENFQSDANKWMEQTIHRAKEAKKLYDETEKTFSEKHTRKKQSPPQFLKSFEFNPLHHFFDPLKPGVTPPPYSESEGSVTSEGSEGRESSRQCCGRCREKSEEEEEESKTKGKHLYVEDIRDKPTPSRPAKISHLPQVSSTQYPNPKIPPQYYYYF